MFRTLSLVAPIAAALLTCWCFSPCSGEEPPFLVNARRAYEYTGEGTNSPQRVEITNTTAKDRVATVNYLSDWRGLRKQSYSISVPAGGRVCTFLYPDSDTSECYQVANAGSTVHRSSSSFTGDEVHVVLQKGLGNDWALLKDDAFDLAVSDCDLATWPADARMYLSQTCLIIPEKTYLYTFDEAHRRAIRQWVLAGGDLMLVRDPEDVSAATEVPLGAGRILCVPDFSFEGLDDKEKTRRMALFVKQYFTESDDSLFSQSPPPYDMNTPSAALGLLLLLFAALTGPACLFLWAPAGKRYRLLVLIPAISVGFSLLLLSLILLDDGTGGKGRRTVRIFINPSDHTAMIIQNQCCRTSVLANTAFDLPQNAAFSGRCRRPGKADELTRTWREGSRCGGDWFTSRSLLEHRILLPVSTRASVTLAGTTPQGAPVFQSTFPATLTHFVYRGVDGRLWRIDTLPPAAKTAALPEKPEFAPGETPKKTSPSELPPGHFHASMEAEEGAELGPVPTLPSIEWETTDTTVCGPVATLTPNHP